MKKNSTITPLVPEQLYQTKQILDVKFDENNRPIEGTGRLIEQSEKEDLVKYIIAQKLPMTLNVYNAVLKRWINGYLDVTAELNKQSEEIISNDKKTK